MHLRVQVPRRSSQDLSRCIDQLMPLATAEGITMLVWQPIETAPRDDDRILVVGGTWIRGNQHRIHQSFPCLVIWDEGEWLICDNEGPKSVVHDPKLWMAIPPVDQ